MAANTVSLPKPDELTDAIVRVNESIRKIHGLADLLNLASDCPHAIGENALSVPAGIMLDELHQIIEDFEIVAEAARAAKGVA